MFSLTNLLCLVLLGTAALYWWQSGVYKGRARELAIQHCKQLELQFLDDSMVITGFSAMRDGRGGLTFRRSYVFEFASTGDRRYHGKLILAGIRLISIDLETYKIPSLE